MNRWNVSEGLEQEARQVINMLENAQVPPDGLNNFTVGDSFRDSLLHLKHDIIKLASDTRFLESIVLGGFGTGKTHFLSYLHWHLEKDAPKDSIISRVDMSRLRNPHDLEMLIVKGLQPLTGSGNYADVLRLAYDKLITQYVTDHSRVSRHDMENMYGVILYWILGKLSADVISPELLKLLELSGPIDSIIKYLVGNKIYNQFSSMEKQASGDHKKFVRSYLKMIRNPNQPISAFEEPARKLSHGGNLTDVIFKVLRFAGFKLVVILVDELETIHRFDESTRRQILVNIRDFRDSLSNIGAQLYPSIAFVCASTREFYENDLIDDAPALYSRWEGNETYLKPLSTSDIDNLIFKLRELFYLAGYNLRPIKEPSNGDEHEVIQLRNQVLADLTSSANPFTTRKLVRTLLRKIRRTWVRT